MFYKQTGLYFNIITHDLEAFYLEKAWVNEKSAQVNNMIVINIGGETTELLYCHNGVVTAPPQKLSIGVGSVKNRFPNINKRFSEYSLDNILPGYTLYGTLIRYNEYTSQKIINNNNTYGFNPNITGTTPYYTQIPYTVNYQGTPPYNMYGHGAGNSGYNGNMNNK